MSIQSSLNSITQTTLKGTKAIDNYSKRDILAKIQERTGRPIGNASMNIDSQVGTMAMDRMQKQRDAMISQKNILTGGNNGTETT